MDDALPLGRQYPREGWAGHANFGPLSRFWIQKHDGFRQLGAHLTQGFGAAGDDLSGGIDAHRPLLSALQQYLGHLEGHHSVEDQHYFPLFKRIEPAAVAGFERLEADHVRVDAAMRDIAGRWAAIHGLWTGNRPHGSELAAWHEVIIGFIGEVDRHLDDEEDLLIPVLLKHGETAFY